MVSVKASVRLKGLNYELLHMLYSVVWMDRNPVKGQPPSLVVTSINDSTHKPTSKHYLDLAIDLRSKNFPNDATKQAFQAALQHELGPEYLVLFEGKGTENEHWHVQRKVAA